MSRYQPLLSFAVAVPMLTVAATFPSPARPAEPAAPPRAADRQAAVPPPPSAPAAAPAAPAAAAEPAPAQSGAAKAATAAAPALPPFTLLLAGEEKSEARFEEIVRKQTCPTGGPDGRFRLRVSDSPGEDGNDWSTIEIEAPNGSGRRVVDRVYRLSGPCWAPDGSYFVYATGGVVKAASPDHAPMILWQDPVAEKGGIFPSEARNFSWGTAMGSLKFILIEDPRRPEPHGEQVELRIAR